MKDLARLFEDPALRRLGWALAAFLWQGTIVAALLACVNALASRRDARLRYAAGCAALLLMLLLPTVTYLVRRESPASPVGTPAASTVPAGSEPRAEATRLAGSELPGAAGIARVFQASAEWLAPWIVPAWLCGVLLLSARFLGGWNAARRLPLQGVRPAPAQLQAVLARLRARLGIPGPVALLESARVSVPTALGVLRPAILLPVCAVAGLSPEALEAVLAHELAHIRRHDYLVNLFQTAAETLLFYHPAVWWVSRRIRIERENCCDDLAVAATGDCRGYVRALVVLEEIRAPRQTSPRPAVAADGGSLWRRVARLLPVSPPSPSHAEDAPRWLAGLLALAMAATVAAAARAPFFGDSPVNRNDSAVSAVPAVSPVSPVAPAPPAAAKKSVPAAPAAPGQPLPTRKAMPVARAGRASTGSAVVGDGEDEKPASPQENGKLSPEELSRLRSHGVTPEFLSALAALGYKQASVGDLVALKVHGVTPEFISEMTALVGKQSLDSLVSLRIHGVTPDFVRGMRSLGYTTLSTDDAVALRIHGVTTDFVKEIQSLGYAAPSVDELTALRIHGVTPEFIRKANASAGTKLSIDELVSRRIHGRSS